MYVIAHNIPVQFNTVAWASNHTIAPQDIL